jgi:hypothetical protein
MAGGQSLSPKSRTMMVSIVCVRKCLILEPKQRIKKIGTRCALAESRYPGVSAAPGFPDIFLVRKMLLRNNRINSH